MQLTCNRAYSRSFVGSPIFAVGLCALLGVCLPAARGLLTGIPEPKAHDEFSYLLAADTFAHFRLTNPTPDLPAFFETEQVLLFPTYMSKYPPGQGLALGIGQMLLGHPIWGVWLSFACFAASLCWMLQAWTSRPWALAITVLAIFSLGIDSYWVMSYWGGALAACGGALLFGGMRRTLRHARVGSSVLMGLGVVLLAVTRPFEGFLSCLPVAAVLGWWLIAGPAESLGAKAKRWVLPFIIVLFAGGAAIAKYNHAVTGQWNCFPYTLHQRQYFWQNVFIFSDMRPAERQENARISRFYEKYRTAPVHGVAIALKAIGNFRDRISDAFLGSLGDVDLKGRGPGGLFWMGAVLVVTLRSRWVWFCLLTIALVILGGSLVWWWWPHYSASILPLVIAVFADAMRRIGLAFRANTRLGSLSPTMIVVFTGCLGAVVFGNAARVGIRNVLSVREEKSDGGLRSDCPVGSRADLVRRLKRQGGMHLVFVRYTQDYNVHSEWVYNGADIQSAAIVFANDLGAERNDKLIARLGGRSVWLVTVASKEKWVQSYRAAERAAPGATPLPVNDTADSQGPSP